MGGGVAKERFPLEESVWDINGLGLTFPTCQSLSGSSLRTCGLSVKTTLNLKGWPVKTTLNLKGRPQEAASLSL